jgi:hypothetical protein
MMHFRQEAARPQSLRADPPFHFWEAQGAVIAQFHRIPDGFLLRFIGRADFAVDFTSETVTCFPVPGVSAAMIAALRHNQVAPLLLNHSGKLVLHAAAIVSNGKAVALSGESGRGKSTLAASFAHQGYPFLTDDGLHLEPTAGGYLAIPSLDSVRLRLDSESALFAPPISAEGQEVLEKSLLPAGLTMPHQSQPVPLQAVYFLGDGKADQVEFGRLAPGEALLELIRHAFMLDVDDRARVRANFERLADLSEAVPIFTLDYPRRFEKLGDVIAAVIAHAQQGETAP